MKPLALLQFVPKSLRPAWLFRRTPKPAPKPDPPPAEEPEPERATVRYIPIWSNGHILPFVVDIEKPRRKRDPYD